MPLRISPSTSEYLFRSYPVRLTLVLGALVAAVLIVHYRILIKKDTRLIKANRIGG